VKKKKKWGGEQTFVMGISGHENCKAKKSFPGNDKKDQKGKLETFNGNVFPIK